MIKAIVFDIGGVVTAHGRLKRLSEHISKTTGMNPEVIEELVHKYWKLWVIDKINEEQFYNQIIKELKIKTSWKKIRIPESKINYADNKIINMIKKLKKKYITAALTNDVKEWFEEKIADYDLLGLFNQIITSYETKTAKPERKIYEIMLQKTGMKAEECVFIDNEKDNLEIPKKMGMKTVHYKNYSQLFEELRSMGIEI
jgi:putative hydrolase of the HAD superfamily